MLQQLGRPGDRDVILRTYIDIRPSGVYMVACISLLGDNINFAGRFPQL